MDAQRCANTLKTLNQVFSCRKESKTTTLTKSKPCGHVLNCLAMFKDRFNGKGFARRELQRWEVEVWITIVNFPLVFQERVKDDNAN